MYLKYAQLSLDLRHVCILRTNLHSNSVGSHNLLVCVEENRRGEGWGELWEAIRHYGLCINVKITKFTSSDYLSRSV